MKNGNTMELNSGTSGAGPEYPSEPWHHRKFRAHRNFRDHYHLPCPQGPPSALLLGPLVPQPTAPQRFVDSQPTNLTFLIF